MGILNNIGALYPNSIAITTPPCEVIFHSCPNPTTIEDIWLAAVIGIIVTFCIWIIGHYIWKSVASIHNAKFNELKSRQEHELAKMNVEAEIKTATNLFNANQTKEQRAWISVADRIKNEGEQIKNDRERLALKLKEAEINNQIEELEKTNDVSTKKESK